MPVVDVWFVVECAIDVAVVVVVVAALAASGAVDAWTADDVVMGEALLEGIAADSDADDCFLHLRHT